MTWENDFRKLTSVKMLEIVTIASQAKDLEEPKAPIKPTPPEKTTAKPNIEKFSLIPTENKFNGKFKFFESEDEIYKGWDKVEYIDYDLLLLFAEKVSCKVKDVMIVHEKEGFRLQTYKNNTNQNNNDDYNRKMNEFREAEKEYFKELRKFETDKIVYGIWMESKKNKSKGQSL